MKSLIIGYGEVGKSLYNILSKEYLTYWIDKNKRKSIKQKNFDIIHICFPYNENFVNSIIEYKNRYKPRYTIIHSSVPVGTSRKLNAIHSPVIGIHPHLEKSFKVFTKFIGGENASEIADYFRKIGIKVYLLDKQETTELIKLQCTTYYTTMIEFTKEMKKKCDELKIPFEAWSIWIDNYNKGYKKLGYPEYCRPNLIPIMTKIGGHCCAQNLRLIDTKFSRFLINLESENNINKNNAVIKNENKN